MKLLLQVKANDLKWKVCPTALNPIFEKNQHFTSMTEERKILAFFGCTMHSLIGKR